jgi:hypothetical protein
VTFTVTLGATMYSLRRASSSSRSDDGFFPRTSTSPISGSATRPSFRTRARVLIDSWFTTRTLITSPVAMR